jgi:hypothetical protein
MLDLPRYLLGVAEILLLVGFATLGASSLRTRLLPDWSGPPAWLATGIVALALLIWVAELLGSVELFEPVPYLVGVAAIGLGMQALDRGSCRRGGVPSLAPRSAPGAGTGSGAGTEPRPPQAPRRRRTPHPDASRGRSVGIPKPGGASVATVVALVVAAAAIVHFATGVRLRLSIGMTGFDSTWYHGPFAAGFFQSGNTWNLHFIAPQFLAWFYPANAELFHAVGMLAFGRDILSPLLNLGWFVGCLLALWCIGRPYRVAPWSLALGAIALSLPALSDQAGEARNDVVGIFFLLAAVAVALNAWSSADARRRSPVGGKGGATAESEGAEDPEGAGRGISIGPLIVAGLATGLAAGTKLNFLLPAAVLVVGLAVIAPRGRRWRALGVVGLAAVAGGGYWYLRNLIHTGNPLPWLDNLGPISLPAPEQALGGREGHSVLGYLTDGGVWSDWFLPGFHHGLTIFWSLLAAAALGGLLLCLIPLRRSLSRNGGEKEQLRLGGADTALCVAGFVGLAAGLAWLVAPTSASGPDGMPRGFESGLRYLIPALVLGLALLPTAPPLRQRLRSTRLHLPAYRTGKYSLVRAWGVGPALIALAALVVAIGYPIQRHYLDHRYANPTFSTPGLDAAFRWARSISDARIATTSTRQYPLYGTDLSNRVQYIGEQRPHGGFVAPTTCPQWRNLLNAGHYDYVVTTRDRLEPGKTPFPQSAHWTAGPGATIVLRRPPTVVYKLNALLDPSACSR